MALYSELTQQEKDDLGAYERYLRGTISSLMKLHQQADPVVWNQFAVDRIDGLLATLDAGEVIPNTSGLGGVQDFTKEDLVSLQGIARSLTATASTNLSLIVKAAGVNVG